jgi:hypothetical protein
VTETDLQRSIRKALAAAGFWTERLNSGRVQTVRKSWLQLCEVGTPDLLVLAPYGFLEVKTRSGRLSIEQKHWHERAARKGVRVAVVRGVAEALDTVRGWQS